MASHLVFAVRDSAMDAFMQPFFVPSTGVAVRSFSDEVNRADSPMNTHPDDYSLYQIGEYEESTGRLNSLPDPIMLSRGKDVITPRS